MNNDKTNPSHYKFLRPEPIEVIKSWKLGYMEGSCLKYLARAGKKEGESRIDDLRKCRWFIDKLIAELIEEGPKLPGGPSAPPSVILKEDICVTKLPADNRILPKGGSSSDPSKFVSVIGPDGKRRKFVKDEVCVIRVHTPEDSYTLTYTPDSAKPQAVEPLPLTAPASHLTQVLETLEKLKMLSEEQLHELRKLGQLKPLEAPISPEKPSEPSVKEKPAPEPSSSPEVILQLLGSDSGVLTLRGPDGWLYKVRAGNPLVLQHSDQNAHWMIFCNPRAPTASPEPQESPKEPSEELSSSLKKEPAVRTPGALPGASMEELMVEELRKGSLTVPRLYIDPKWNTDDQEVS